MSCFSENVIKMLCVCVCEEGGGVNGCMEVGVRVCKNDSLDSCKQPILMCSASL